MKKIATLLMVLLTVVALADSLPTVATEMTINESLELMQATVVTCPEALVDGDLGLVICAKVPSWMTPDLIRSSSTLLFSSYEGWGVWQAWTYTGDWYSIYHTHAARNDMVGFYLFPDNRVFFIASNLDD